MEDLYVPVGHLATEYVDIRPMNRSEMFLSSSSVQFKIPPATNSLYEMSKVWLWLYS